MGERPHPEIGTPKRACLAMGWNIRCRLYVHPTENRTVSVASVEACKRRCAFCSNRAVVGLLPGLQQRICADALTPPLANTHTVIIKGRFTSYAGLVLELHRGPEAGAYLIETLNRLQLKAPGGQENAAPSPR